MLSDSQRAEILRNAEKFFINRIVSAHIRNIEKASSLSVYNYNPFLLNYLAVCIDGEASCLSIAKALFYPRVLGTSINTSFGSLIQDFIANVLPKSEGTIVSGMDIQFIDAEDGRLKYCQVKAGPNTINHDDVKTIIDHFQAALNLSRQNKTHQAQDDFVVGILYGDTMSSSYREIQKRFPVYTGKEFWFHLTGDEHFYKKLHHTFAEAALKVNINDTIEKAISKLAKEIQASKLL